MSTTTEPRAPMLSSFAGDIRTSGKRAVRSAATIITKSGTDEIFYVPFEHVERDARIVIVGITPGPTQLEMAYAKTKELLDAGVAGDEVLRAVKAHSSFGGPLRTRLVTMLRELGFSSVLGISREEDLWGVASHLLHSTSVVPHAAFRNGKMFAGSFAQVLASPAMRGCFERHFVPELAMLRPDAMFVALGPTPLAALEHCAAAGLIRHEQILGALAHASPSSGSEVDVYLGKKDPSSLSERDPVRHRVPRLLAQAAQMRRSMERLRACAGTAELHLQTAAREVGRAFSPRTMVPQPSIAMSTNAALEANARLYAHVSRGAAAGTVLRPHLHLDGCYVVSKTRFEEDYIRVPADRSIEDYLRQGLKLRMSAPGIPQSLIRPESILGRTNQ